MAQAAVREESLPNLRNAQQELAARTRLSQRMAADRAEVINGAMAASGICPPPIFVAHNEGATFEDIDGNEFLDTCMGFGVHVLGHRPKAVEGALRAQLSHGWHYSLRGKDQLKYANMILDAAEGNERVVFGNTGTEATLYAIRAARAVSGRNKIALFDVSYHGAHDSVLVWPGPGSTADTPVPMPFGHGITEGVLSDVILLPYRHPAAFDAIAEHAGELAAVIVEPVQGSRPDPDVGEFLTDLRSLCDDLGLILIFDEVLTGFRLAYGGAQERYGVASDMTTYGKTVGGGLPIGVVAGRKELMESFGDFTAPSGIFFGGTFSGNPLSVTAGLATLEALHSNPEIYNEIDRLTARLTTAFNRFCEDNQYPARILSCGSMWQMFFDEAPLSSFGYEGKEAEGAFYLHCLNMGVFIHATHRCYLSAAHTDEDVDRLLVVCKEALSLVREDGLA
jgi:glutamate-1-semialdehyde-2,1-aminomutase